MRTSTKCSHGATKAASGSRRVCSPATSARILTAWRELEVGGLVINGSSNFRLDHVPFGGVKDSGFGRESPRMMIDDYTVVKTMLIRGMSIWGHDG